MNCVRGYNNITKKHYITIDAVGRVNIGVDQDNSLAELINGAVACPLLIEAETSHALAWEDVRPRKSY